MNEEYKYKHKHTDESRFMTITVSNCIVCYHYAFMEAEFHFHGPSWRHLEVRKSRRLVWTGGWPICSCETWRYAVCSVLIPK